MASVELRGLTKRFGSHTLLDDVSLRIDHGKLVCLLGPSGCGKTTTLRLIAGFSSRRGAKFASATACCPRRTAWCRPKTAGCR